MAKRFRFRYPMNIRISQLMINCISVSAVLILSARYYFIINISSIGNNHQSNENSNPLTKLCKKGGTAILQRQNLKITDNKVILLIAGAGGINLPHQHYVPPCCLNEFKFQHTVNCLDQLSFDSQRSRKLFHIAFVGDSIMRHQFVSFIRVNIKSGLQ